MFIQVSPTLIINTDKIVEIVMITDKQYSDHGHSLLKYSADNGVDRSRELDKQETKTLLELLIIVKK